MTPEAQREGVRVRSERNGPVERTTVTIETERAAQTMQRPCGQYVTLGFEQALQRELAAALAPLLPREGGVLVVGLGNRHVTADALGPRVADATFVTRHLKRHLPPSLAGRVRSVCAAAPGVLGVTGMETAEVVRGIVRHVQPAAVIAATSWLVNPPSGPKRAKMR